MTHVATLTMTMLNGVPAAKDGPPMCRSDILIILFSAVNDRRAIRKS